MQSDLLIHLLFLGLVFGLIVYVGFLEWFKVQRGAQGDAGFSHCTRPRLRRRALGLVLAALVTTLFFAGLYLVPLTAGSVAFVLYWWITLTLTLGLFIPPMLDFLETSRTAGAENDDAKTVVVRMIHEIQGETGDGGEGSPIDPGADDGSGNSTLH